MSIVNSGVVSGEIMHGGLMRSQSVKPANPFMLGFTAANTVNAKKAFNLPKANAAPGHVAVGGNSTKAGWGSNGSAFGVPGTILGASRHALSQIQQWATLLAAAGYPVSTDTFWGDAGWGTPISNVNTFDPRLLGSASATLSTSVLGPGGKSFATTNATDTWTFTPGNQFDTIVLFYAGIGSSFSVTGDISGIASPASSIAGSGNNIQHTTFTFGALQNAAIFQGLSASGFRIYGGYTYKSSDPNKLFIHNMGWGGSVTSQWASTSQGTAPKDAINALAPQLILWSEGINDPNNGVSTSTHTTNVTTFINNVKKPTQDVIVYDDHWTASSDVDGASGHATLANITACLAANKTLALSTFGIPYVDTPSYSVSYATQKANGNEYDVSHENTQGQADQAANLLMPMTQALLAA